MTDSRSKLSPFLKSSMWDLFEEYLKELEIKELKSMARATTEQEMFRKQGRVNMVEQLLLLKRQTLGDQ
jgi:hypothetical protein